MTESTAVVEMRNIKKNFAAVQALRGVDLVLHHNEVLGLVGDNAAGKSTLMKVLSGAYIPDEGEILIEGDKVHMTNPLDARRLGIEMVYQDLALANNLDVTANVFLGREAVSIELGPLGGAEVSRLLLVGGHRRSGSPLHARVLAVAVQPYRAPDWPQHRGELDQRMPVRLAIREEASRLLDEGLEVANPSSQVRRPCADGAAMVLRTVVIGDVALRDQLAQQMHGAERRLHTVHVPNIDIDHKVIAVYLRQVGQRVLVRVLYDGFAIHTPHRQNRLVAIMKCLW